MLKGKKIGFIGAGMMAEAFARGLLKAGVSPDAMLASDPSETRQVLFGELGIRCAADNRAVAESADILMFVVKPHLIPEVAKALADTIKPEQLVLSIAAGIPVAAVEALLKPGIPVVRVMPNTPCLVGEGAIGIAPGKNVSRAHADLAVEVLGACGTVAEVTDDKMDAVTGLSGSGPAYVYTFIEALAAGGLRMGLPRDAALTLAAQTVLGAAKMVLEAAEHPAVLRDRVTTPAGTTIAGLTAMEAGGFRSTVIEAVTAATERSIEIGKASGG